MKTPEEVKGWFDAGLVEAVGRATNKYGIPVEVVAGWLEQHVKDMRLANNFVVVNKLGNDNPPNTHINN